jgi:hypothetical protein
MFGYAWRERGSYVQHIVAAGDSFRPSRIVFKIGGEETQAISRIGAALLQQCPHIAFTLQVADSRPNLIAR